MATSDDELAHTATAPGQRTAATAPGLGATLGRYRLERTLGEGGMGVVHAAFDPDLERRVALKVLRVVDAGGDARQRLLREARAMARLTHDNVVVVHEVGTAGDRDYVAMELIDGETLAAWLTVEPRSVEEIVAAFCAAGRGLAAAHAAGLVHRDFKPHNVLRRRDGRILVTDFGLARGVEATAEVVALDTTLDLHKGGSQPSDLVGLTATGAVLGTPAYMAPEQWSGGTVGPAADQFGFCVALWEALTGARPFKGTTVDELKAEVKRGPASLDDSKVPRRLRRALVRGLDPDPAKRWPNMNALLATISRADRRVGVALALGGGALVAGAVALFALHGRGPTCEPPALDPTKVWSAAFAKEVPPALSELFNAQIAHWAVSRATACTAEPSARGAQLHCLDGVLARIDVMRRVYTPLQLGEEDVAEELVDPSVCLVPVPPRLTLPDTDDVVAAYGLVARGDADPKHRPTKEAQTFAARPGLDPCSRALALAAVENGEEDFQAKRATIAEVVAMAEQCEDDRLHADTLLLELPYLFELPVIGPKGMAAIKRANAAVSRVAEPQLTARIEILRAYVASQGSHWKEALDLMDHAIAVYDNVNQPRAAVRTVLEAIEMRFNRSTIADLAAIRALVAKWLPVARALKTEATAELAVQLAHDDALARYWQGDTAGGHAELVRLWKPTPDKTVHPIEGEVVDRVGKPMAGATVVTGTALVADSISVLLPISRYHIGDHHLRVATTDAQGHFAIPDGPEQGVIVAQLGDRRSVAVAVADHVVLTVLPTRRLAGKVELQGMEVTQSAVIIDDPSNRNLNLMMLATVMPDHTFVLDGVQQSKVDIAVAGSHDTEMQQVQYTHVPASTEPTTGLVLAISSTTRTLDVIARSTLTTPLDTAQVFVLPGRVHFANAGELMQQQHTGLFMQFARHVAGEAAPQVIAGKLRTGDLIAHFSDVPAGEVTVCVIGLTGDMMDTAAMRKVQAHVSELELRCETVDGAAVSAVVATPPQKQFD